MKKTQRSNALGEALRIAREAAGLSQVALSLSMKYDYNVVTSWENGSKPFYAEEWPRLCALVPGLDPALVVKHKAELNLKGGRKLKPRPSRLQPQVTAAIKAVVDAKAAGRMMTEVAADIGIEYLGFWKMLKGDSNPTLAQLGQLADYFQVDTDVLLGRRPLDGASYNQLVEQLAAQNTELEELRRDLERTRELNDLLLADRDKPQPPGHGK